MIGNEPSKCQQNTLLNKNINYKKNWFLYDPPLKANTRCSTDPPETL